jgi:hypothetical protein
MPVDEPVALPQRIYPMRRRLSTVSEANDTEIRESSGSSNMRKWTPLDPLP